MYYYRMPGLYKKDITELGTIEEQVLWILYHHKDTRDSDQALIYIYWTKVDNMQTLDYNLFKDLTSAEFITRRRRNIQNTLCMFVPTDPEVINSRLIKEQQIRQWAISQKKMADNFEEVSQ